MRWQRQPTDETRKRDMKGRFAALEREIKEAEEAGDALAKAIALNNLGTAHADLEEWAAALEQYELAAAAVPADAAVAERATPHGNASNAARRLDNWPLALHHALLVDALGVAADDTEQKGVATAAVGLVRHATGEEFEALLDAAIAELPEDQRGLVRREEHLHPTVVSRDLPGRNDPCHCGSGQKYKHCHMKQDRAEA